MEKDLNELKQFVAEIKADREAQKEKEKRESWTKYTSLSIVIIAVLSAIATQYSGKFSGRVLVNLNESTFNQAKASDQWSFYQASSIKQNLYEVTQAAGAKASDASDPKLQEKVNAKIEKYEKTKAEAKKNAEELEKKRDAARDVASLASRQGGEMGLAISLFSISIAIASICLVVKKKPLWYVSLILAAFATVQAAYGIWFVH